ncbi:hypothetical protein D3C78_1325460 [compost metagenome]
MAAAADPAKGHAQAGETAHPAQQVAVVAGRDGVGADDEQGVQLGGVVDGIVRNHAHAVAGLHRLMVGGDQAGAIKRALGGQVGHAQGFHGRGAADGVEVGNQQETEGLHAGVPGRTGCFVDGRCHKVRNSHLVLPPLHRLSFLGIGG